LVQYSFAKKLQSQTVIRENPHKKGLHKMLMKLTPACLETKTLLGKGVGS